MCCALSVATQRARQTKALILIVVLLECTAGWGDGPAERSRMRFTIRGTLPWHNFLSGPTAWNEPDYEQYLDRLASLGLNFVGFHCYTGGAERYATYVEPMIRVEYRDVVPLARFDTSLTARWGYRPLAVSEFVFGSNTFFTLPKGAKAFGADCAVLAENNEDHYRRAQSLMRRVLEMAHARGIQVAMGFEFGIHPPEFASIVPPESWIRGAMLPDPTHPASIEILRVTIDNILQAYPDIDWIWLWLHEHTMYVGKARMPAGFNRIYNRDARLFKDADAEDVVFTGVWSLAYIRQAHQYIQEKAPQVKIAVGGWGGGSQLPGVLRGLDTALPSQIVFACLNPGQGSLPQPQFLVDIAKHRRVWAIPWLEGDARLWHLQPRVSLMRKHVKLAHEQGLGGVVAIHWRTEETRLNLEAFARFADKPQDAMTVEDIYRVDCEKLYGAQAAERLVPMLVQMDAERWLDRTSSPEYSPYNPKWGRIDGQLRQRLQGLIEQIEAVGTTTSTERHQTNLAWLATNLEFTLLLDEVSRKLEPAYVFKQRWLLGEIEPDKCDGQRERALRTLNSAPVERLLRTYAARIRSRGQLGVLSSINQKLWLQYKELREFLSMVRREDTDRDLLERGTSLN